MISDKKILTRKLQLKFQAIILCLDEGKIEEAIYELEKIKALLR